MMRRTVLLLATTALALIAAGGIALAATFTCTTNPCVGTTEDDMITGTEGAETINGKAGNDVIFAQDGNDRLNGEEGNDTMHGENGIDSYILTPNWGNDNVIDGQGRNSIVTASDTAGAMPNLTVNLVSDASRPEVSDGNGNTMNWENNDVDNVVTGAGDDVISQRPQKANSMIGGGGNDTYKGYVPGVRNGSDQISDSSGTADVLDLSNMSLTSDFTFSAPRFSDANHESLQISLPPPTGLGCLPDDCNDIRILRYFDNTSPDVCLSGPGPGVIDIKISGVQSVDFEEVRHFFLGCPPPDTTAPDTSITSGPNGPTNSSAPTFTFTFTGSDNRTTTAKLKYQYQLDSGGWSTASTSTTANFTGLSEGAHLFEVRAVDETGNVDANPAQRSFRVDTTAPKVTTVSPADPTIPLRSTDVEANFSEKVASSSINTSTFKLYKCTSTTSTNCANQVTNAPVSLSTDGLKAILNPSTSLGSRTRYKAVVTTGVTDEAGNALDQDPSAAGNQEKVWYFTTGRT